MILLAIVFFGLASWNVGLLDAPVTDWQATHPQSFYIDFGSLQTVQNIYFWVKNGNATVNVYSGSSTQWIDAGHFNLQQDERDYYKWYSLTLNVNTQFLGFNVTPTNYDSRPQLYWVVSNPTDTEPSPFIDALEIGASDANNHQIPIVGLTADNDTDATITRLVDEQNKLEFPPTYMTKTYFDEVYFARSAIQFTQGHEPQERTHPPLGKLIQAVGVEAFGETPFGWRIMGVIFGTLIVPLIYLLGKKLFGTWIGGFSAAFLITFDFMHFTMARIGTVDTYVVFFSLLAQITFLVYFINVLRKGWKESSVWPLFFAVVFFSLGFSTKFGFPIWYALGLLALLFAWRLKDVVKLKGGLGDKYVAFFDRPFLLLFAFIGVVAAIYFATYIPEMLMGNSPLQIFSLQIEMLRFHGSGVPDSTSAPWWSWPFMFGTTSSVPHWFDISYIPPLNNPVSTIVVMGNPVLWWLGFALILVLTENAIHGRILAANLWRKVSKPVVARCFSIRGDGWDIPAIYIVAVFFFSWLPYVVVGRSTYIYHFYVAVPLLCLGITYFINKYWYKPAGKVAAVAVFVGVVATFGLFYPVISGAPVDTAYIHKYLDWIPSWYFSP